MSVRKFTFTLNDLKLSLPAPSASSAEKKGSNKRDKTKFDLELQSTWKDHMAKDHFRYQFSSPESRRIPGRFGYLAQLNPNRLSNRRPPQSMLHLRQPFCPEKFNFTKVDMEREAVFVLEDDDDSGNNNGHLLINVSPLEFCNSLLVPRLFDNLPQVLTQDSIALAMKAVLLSGSRSLKAGFNSLCAHASVNHQHWHLFYIHGGLSEEEADEVDGHNLVLETVPATPLVGDCFVIDSSNYPAAAFAFQVSSGTKEELDRVSQSIHKLTQFLTEENIAHNVIITRGTRFENKREEGNPSNYDALRVFVWARENIVGSKESVAFYVAVCELSGLILCYERDVFESLAEEEVAAAHRENCQKVFDRLQQRVMGLLS